MDQTKSPFPGMDPYLEQHWLDVHQRLCDYACDALQPQLGDRFVARLNERLVVEEPGADPRAIHPDVLLSRSRHSRPRIRTGENDAGAVATLDEPTAKPFLIGIKAEPFNQGFIEIFERGQSGRLVTVIEFVSPTNKLPGDGRIQYRQKRRQLFQARVSLVEIDLTRQGKRRLIVPTIDVPAMHETYFVSVFRGYRFSPLEVFGLPLREPLPNIPVPLRQGDCDVVLKLQSLIDLAYLRGAYATDVDYSKPPSPPLRATAAAWAKQLLKRKKKR
jgi:hypothetical protein